MEVLKRFLLISIFIQFFANGFAQDEFKGANLDELTLIHDTIVVVNNFPERKVIYILPKKEQDTLIIKMHNVLGFPERLDYAFVVNIDSTIYKRYSWNPYYGLYYVGYVDLLSPKGKLKAGYSMYPDESVRDYNTYNTGNDSEKEYMQSEYRLDLSIVKTFPKYFRELYEKKYGAINEP